MMKRIRLIIFSVSFIMDVFVAFENGKKTKKDDSFPPRIGPLTNDQRTRRAHARGLKRFIYSRVEDTVSACIQMRSARPSECRTMNACVLTRTAAF